MRLGTTEVCACLLETGGRQVEIVERCVRCGACMNSDALKDAEARVATLEATLRENVGDAYNLLTQGESPTQRRRPSARSIYDRSSAALHPETEGKKL